MPRIDNLFHVIYVSIVAYAILKYRLMDISLVIKKTTAYSLVTTAITFAYVLVVVGFERLFRVYWGDYAYLAALPAALVIAITFMPLRERLQKITDRIFFRRAIEYQSVIRKTAHTISSLTDLFALLGLIKRTIIEIMSVEQVAVLLYEDRLRQYVAEKKGQEADDHEPRLSVNNPLAAYLREKKDAVVLEEVKSYLRGQGVKDGEREQLEKIAGELERFGAALAVPSFIKDKLTGIFLIGEKLSGELFNTEDLDMLLTIASETAIATENARLYRDIIETRDYLNNLVQSTDDAILTFDRAGNLLSWNNGAEKIFGYKAAEVVGKPAPIFDQREIERYVHRVLWSDEIRPVETLKKNKIGKEIPLLLTFSPIRKAGGEILGVSVIIKDISELKKVDRLKHELLSVVSHELKTPLTYIILYLSKLLDEGIDNLKETQKGDLDVIREQSEYLQNLIDTIIDISRIEAGKPIELNKQDVLLEDVIRESVTASSPAFSSKGITLNVRGVTGPLPLQADKNKLLKVMTNLLGNAQKFTPSGGQVNIMIDKDKDNYVVQVEDTGVGIPSGFLDRIFDRFYQIDTSDSRQYGGIGMGLAITREIIKSHNGSIWAESEGEGKGARFKFTLPVKSR